MCDECDRNAHVVKTEEGWRYCGSCYRDLMLRLHPQPKKRRQRGDQK